MRLFAQTFGRLRSFVVALPMLIVATFGALALPIVLHAQSVGTSTAAGIDMSTCAMYAPIIAIAVSLAKAIPFVRTHPKLLAGLLTVIATGFHVFASGPAIPTATLVACVLATFSMSIASYEVVLKPAGRLVKPPMSSSANTSVPPSR